MPQFSARFNAPVLCNALKKIERFRDKKAIIPVCEGYLFETMGSDVVFVLGERSFAALKKTLTPELLSPLRALENVFFLDRDIFIERITTLIGESHVEAVSSACEGVVRVAASDTYVGGFVYVTAIIKEQGAFSIRSDILELIEEVGLLDVTITESDDHWANIKHKGATYKMGGMPGGDMVDLIRIPSKDSKLTTMPSADFMRLLRTASLFRGVDESRLFINGVNIQSHNSDIMFAATDGYRLCLLSSKAELPASAEVTFPNRFIDSLRIDDDGIVTVYKDETRVYLQFNNEAFFSCGLYNDITFVEYRKRLIEPFPDESFVPVVVPQVELVIALKRILVVCDDSKYVILTATPGGLTLSVPDNAFGEGQTTIVVNIGDLGYQLTMHGIGCLRSEGMASDEVDKLLPFIKHAITTQEEFLESASRELSFETMETYRDNLLAQAVKKRIGVNGAFFLQQMRLFDHCDTVTIKFPLDTSAPIFMESSNDSSITQMILRLNA